MGKKIVKQYGIKPKNVVERYRLPLEVKFCKRCIVSNQRPRIVFDDDGVCSACRYSEYKRNKIDWEKREYELKELVKKYKRHDGGYEVVVPASGGKDSVYVAHQMAYKYGMKVLTVTWSPHLYTQIGWKNFQSMIHKGGLDNILGTPNGVIHKKLTKLAIEEMGDPFLFFNFGQIHYPVQIACKFGIPLIMYGENGELEYTGDMKNADNPKMGLGVNTERNYFSDFSPAMFSEYGIDPDDLKIYELPSSEEIKKVGVEEHFFGYYKMWVPQENYYYAVEHSGFEANKVRTEGTYSKYASIDDKIDGFHYYMMYVKFGIGRATADAAHEIRDGHLTREEGVALVKKYDGEFPDRYFKTFLSYCGITEEYFWQVMDSWRSPHLWKEVDGEWKLRHNVAGTGLDDN